MSTLTLDITGFHESLIRDKTTLMVGMNEILTLATIGSLMEPHIYGPIKTIISKTMKQLENKQITDFANDPKITSY